MTTRATDFLTEDDITYTAACDEHGDALIAGWYFWRRHANGIDLQAIGPFATQTAAATAAASDPNAATESPDLTYPIDTL